MDVSEPPIRNREFLELRSRVPMDLGPLTTKALPGPFGDVPLDAVPHKPLKYEADRCLYPPGAPDRGEGRKCGIARSRESTAGMWFGGVPEEDDSAHVTLFERKAGDGCTDGDEVRIVTLSGGQVGQV